MAIIRKAVSVKPRVKMTKSTENRIKPNKKDLVVAHEIKLAKILAGNNKALSDRTLRRLKKWFDGLESQMSFSEDAFMRIWKGLFYYMWMSDKPLIQEECANNIAKLVDFKDVKTSLLFFKCFLKTMINEWFGIDYLRLDKFLMLVRRVLRQSLNVIRQVEWDLEAVKIFQDILSDTVLKVECNMPLSLSMHVSEIYLEELAKVSKGKISEEHVLEFLRPFAWQLVHIKDFRQSLHVKRHVFRYLMRQSDIGIEFQERFEAWRHQGFPGKTIDSMDRIELEAGDLEAAEPDEDIGPLDPRAGKVHVTLPQLKFDSGKIADMLTDLRFKPGSNSHSRKSLLNLAQQFREMAAGRYPLGMKRLNVRPAAKGPSTKLKSSLKRLERLECQLKGDSKKAREAKRRNLNIRKAVESELQKYPAEGAGAADLTAGGGKPENGFEDFVAKSEGGLFGARNGTRKGKKTKTVFEDKTMDKVTPLKKKKRKLEVVDAECDENNTQFRRNSGVWEVADLDMKKCSSPAMTKRAGGPWHSERALVKPSRVGEPCLVKNPFSPVSVKKVKIALSLNGSQDTSEYQASLANSPGIPYDAERRPIKTLLKRKSLLGSAINPFYRPEGFYSLS